MIEKVIHLVSFDVPFPPVYGGIIDVYGRLSALKKAGYYVILHAFSYREGTELQAEPSIYNEVYFYKRDTSVLKQLSSTPYIVNSRINRELIRNIAKREGIVLLEGLHNAWLLNEPELANRFKIVRLHNIEHEYYRSLATNTTFGIKKLFFLLESFRLKMYEKIVNKADLLVTISVTDSSYFGKNFPDKNILCLPPFHIHDTLKSKTGKGRYAVFFANLSVPENEAAVTEILHKWKTSINYPLVVAGKNPSLELKKQFTGDAATLIENPSVSEMNELIQNAAFSVVWGKSESGSKLRLFDAMYLGRHILVHTSIAPQKYTEGSLYTFFNMNSLAEKVEILINKEFTEKDMELRKELLSTFQGNEFSVNLLTQVIDQHLPTT